MSHYDITRWTDYVRGLITGQEHAEMTLHREGCEACRATSNLLTSVVARVSADRQYQVPEYAVRDVRALFSTKAQPAKSVLQKLAAKLVFETFDQPVMAGVRAAGGTATRHALYEAGDYSVDLRVEEQQGTRQVNMVGQLALRSRATGVLDQVPIKLMSGRQLLAETVSNQFGEFQMNYEPRRPLKLHIPVSVRDELIELQLGALVPKRRKTAGRKQ